MNTVQLRIIALSLVLLASGFVGGCGEELFNNSTSSTETRLNKYWGGDSAVETSKSREKASDMGFGYPTGPAEQ